MLRKTLLAGAAAVLVAATNLAGTTEYERLRTTLLERGAI